MMTMSIRPLLLVSSLLSAPLAAQERADTARIDPVVISATRIPLSQGLLPVAVTIITGDELRLRGVATVSDALGSVSSAYVAQSGSQGATTSLFLRGGESKYVKVLVDGVSANEAGGTFDFASLTTDNVERIEIVRGPASVIYGADAVTGVVHVITRRGTGAPRVDTDLRMGLAPRDAGVNGPSPGTMRTVDASVTTSGAMPSGSYSLALGRHRSTGLYAFNNGYLNNTLSSRLQFTPGRVTEIRLALRYTDYQFNYPTTSGGVPTDSNALRTEDRVVLGLEVERRVGARGGGRAVLALSSSMNEGGTDDAVDPGDPAPSSFVSQDKTRRRGAELRYHLIPTRVAALTVGLQVEQQDQRSQSQSQSTFGPFNSVFSAARRNAGAYTELVVSPMSAMTATVGARVDDNEQFGAFGTGRVGVSWRPLRDTRFRATAGTAFREPTFFENYSTGFVTGNPALRPERILSVDGGLEQTFLAGRARVALTGFAQRFRDMIDYEGTGASCGFSYCNVAHATSTGLEAEVDGRVAGPLRASFGATLLRTRVVDPGFDSASGGLYERGQRLLRRPDVKWNAELALLGSGPFSASARLIAMGERDDRFFGGMGGGAERTTLPAYHRVDISGAYRLTPARGVGGGGGASMTFRIENLGNVHYQHVHGFLAARRTVVVGVRLSS
ncbi:MAG: TonB-dependent receptor [Gemmatimonadaceae bacterium]